MSRADTRASDRGQAHFLDHVVRGDIGADTEIDAGTAITPEILERVAVAGERRRAVRDVRAGIGQGGQVRARVPAHP